MTVNYVNRLFIFIGMSYSKNTISVSVDTEWIATFDGDISFNILRAFRVSFLLASS